MCTPDQNPVLRLGHSNRALLDHFSRAPKLPWRGPYRGVPCSPAHAPRQALFLGRPRFFPGEAEAAGTPMARSATSTSQGGQCPINRGFPLFQTGDYASQAVCRANSRRCRLSRVAAAGPARILMRMRAANMRCESRSAGRMFRAKRTLQVLVFGIYMLVAVSEPDPVPFVAVAHSSYSRRAANSYHLIVINVPGCVEWRSNVATMGWSPSGRPEGITMLNSYTPGATRPADCTVAATPPMAIAGVGESVPN